MSQAVMHRQYAWPGLRIAVECADAASLDWLDEFLTPSFGAEAGSDGDYAVRLVVDSERYERASEASGTDGQIDVFVQDASVVRLPAFEAHGRWSAFDKSYRAVYRVKELDSPVEILHGGTGIEVRGGLMRVVRELAMNHALDRGDTILHAACLRLGEGGLIIAGPKGAGKTTLLLHLLGAEAARYVTNDRLLVYSENGSVIVRGVPTIVCIRDALFDYFPGMRERLMDGWYRWLLTLEECSAKPPPPPSPWPDGRIGISPSQLCALVSRPAVEAATPRVAVFPEITLSEGGVSVEPLSAQETASRLQASLFAAAHAGARSRLFGRPGQPDRSPEELAAACQDLARSVRGFRCELGHDAAYTSSGARILAEKLTIG